MYPTLLNALRETLMMVVCSSLLTLLIGIPLGIMISLLAQANNKILKGLYYVALGLMQFARITPYLLIMILFIPLSNWFIDQKITYSSATIVPLTTAGVLLLAYKVYTTLYALSQQWVTTTRTMGATTQQAIRLILLPESLGAIVQDSTHVCALMVGFSAIAGALGAGGLGQLAIERSINEPNLLLVAFCVILLITMQQIISLTGNLVVAKQGK